VGLFRRGVNFLKQKRTFVAQDQIYSFLKEPGGSIEMAVDGSTPVSFDHKVPANQWAYIDHVHIVIQDGTITPEKFGGISELTNGLQIQILNKADAVILDFCDGETIKKNSDFITLAGVDLIVDTLGAADNAQYITWKLFHSGEALFLEPDQTFRVVVRDDLTGITQYRMMLHGIKGLF